MGSGMGRGLMAQVKLKVEEGFLVGHIWGIQCAPIEISDI